MDKDRETAALMAAAILIGPIDRIPRNDLEAMMEHGNVRGAFICGVRWADRTPESPWVNISERMPEDSLPELTKKELERQSVKVMILRRNGQVMEAVRRISLGGEWYWNIPVRMRDDITHWMPIPLVPNVE